MTAEQFGDRLRDLRERRGLSRRELSVMIPVSQATLAGWEQGRNMPGLDMAAIIADFFGVSLDYLAGRAAIPYNAPKRQ